MVSFLYISLRYFEILEPAVHIVNTCMKNTTTITIELWAGGRKLTVFDG